MGLPAPRESLGHALEPAAMARLRAHLERSDLAGPGPVGTPLELASGDGLPEEAYLLELRPEGVRLEAGAEAGFHRGIETLAALLAAKANLPALRIQDQPLHAWRGLMLDCSRHFWPAPMLHRVLEEVAFGRGNRLHLHLTDDQGWRLPMPGHPELEELGSWRLEPDETRHGGCYTVSELQELVRHGLELGIEILPEVDLPGHCGALLAALPRLSCDGRVRPVPHAWGCHEALLCLGKPTALDFLEELLRTLTSIFPLPVIHLGGDEVPAQVWARCPDCVDLAARESLSVEHLPAWWLKHAGRLLAQTGRRGAFWDEALDHGVPDDSMIFAWRGQEAVRRSLALGRQTVACPQRPCYLDHYPGLEHQAMAIGGHNTWADLRAFDPLDGLTRVASPDDGHSSAHGVLGGQGNLWTEYVNTPELLMERLQPRLAALLESLWSGVEPEAATGAPCFAERLHGILQEQDRRSWIGRIDAPAVHGTPIAEPGAEIRLHHERTLAGTRLEESRDDGRSWEVLETATPDTKATVVSCFRLDAPGGQVVLVRQTLANGRSSAPLQLDLRWEKPWPELSPSNQHGVLARWLRAAGPDWRMVVPGTESDAFSLADLVWPREQVEEEVVRWHLRAGEFLRAVDPRLLEGQVPPTPSLPPLSPESLGLGLRREVRVAFPRTGTWTFRVTTHDLTRLWIDDRLVIDQDGFRPGAMAVAHQVLAQGTHRLRVDWLHLRGGGCHLEWLIDGEWRELSPVPFA